MCIVSPALSDAGWDRLLFKTADIMINEFINIVIVSTNVCLSSLSRNNMRLTMIFFSSAGLGANIIWHEGHIDSKLL